MLPHLVWRISKGLGSNIIPRGRVSLDHRIGGILLGFSSYHASWKPIFWGLHMVAPSKGEIFEDAREHEVFPWRALYKLTQTKTNKKKNWCLLCRLDFTLKLVFSWVKNNCWCVLWRPGAYLRICPPSRLQKSPSKLKQNLNNDWNWIKEPRAKSAVLMNSYTSRLCKAYPAKLSQRRSFSNFFHVYYAVWEPLQKRKRSNNTARLRDWTHHNARTLQETIWHEQWHRFAKT